MDKKKWIAVGGACALAALILAAVLLGGPQDQTPGGHAAAPETAPSAAATVPNQTLGTIPPETTGDLPTEPEQTEPAAAADPTGPVPTEPERTQPPAETLPELFPAELEGGRLTVHSLFSFTGMNPDADNMFGEDIAGIQLTNTSGEHMTWAEITAVLTDGITLTFRAEDVPPDMTVMAFCLEHEPISGDARCEELFGEAEFESGDLLQSDLVQISTDGIDITLRNVSGRDLTDLRVICHSLLDGGCFGGTTYEYKAALSAGESTVIHAVDCILGMAQVVRVELGG